MLPYAQHGGKSQTNQRKAMKKSTYRKIRKAQNNMINELCAELADRAGCPEEVFEDDFYIFNHETHTLLPPSWCSIAWHRDHEGEVDSSCDCGDTSQCWCNYMQDMFSFPRRKPKWTAEHKKAAQMNRTAPKSQGDNEDAQPCMQFNFLPDIP